MRSRAVQIVNSAGTTVACYFDVDNIQSLNRLHPGHLMIVAPKGLISRQMDLPDDEQPLEPERFVVASDQAEKETLQMVEPIRCYLRDPDMNAQIISVNPYQSVRWLIGWLRQQRNHDLKLIVNETQLKENGDSLVKYLHEQAIIHILNTSKAQEQISELLIKEPGEGAQIKKLEQIPANQRIHLLAEQVAQLTGIHISDLHLVYGGRILSKGSTLQDYSIHSRSVIYAVDAKKYMKKISIMDYKKRIQEVRKFKANNQIIQRKMQEERQRNKSQVRKPAREEIQESVKQIALKQKNQENIQYFQEKQMNIQSEQMEQFRKIPNDDLKGQERHHGPIEPPDNTPKGYFKKKQSEEGADNQQLKEGRIKTEQKEMYEDAYGYVHEHQKQKYVYKDGHSKIVDTEMVEDNEGNIIQTETDTIQVTKDSKGHTHQHEVDVIEENGEKRIVDQDIDKDEEGNVVKVETDVYETEIRQDGSKVKHERDVISENGKQTIVETEVIENAQGEVTKIQTDIKQTETDQQGNIHEHQKDIIEENGRTTVIDRDIIKDVEGNQLRNEKTTSEIMQDSQGNTYKHQHIQLSEENRVTITDRDIVTDSQGNVISKQTDVKVVEGNDEDNSIHKHETDVIEEGGVTTIIEKDSLEDSDGNVRHKETKVQKIRQTEEGIEIKEERDVEDLVEGDADQQQYTEEIEKDVDEDEEGNVHTHEKKTTHYESGKVTVVETDTQKDPQGDKIRSETDVLEIEQNEQGKMHRHETDIIEEKGKTTMMERDEVDNQDGPEVHTDIIEVEEDQAGNIHKHQTEIVESHGHRTVTERDVVEDAEGNVIRAVSDSYEDDEPKQNGIQISNKQQEQEEQNQPIQTKIQTDEEGNTHIHRHQVKQSNDGRVIIVQNDQTLDKDGKVTRIDTDIAEVQINDGIVRKHETETTEKQGRTAIVERDEYRDEEGVVAHTDIIQWEKGADGDVHRHEMEIDERKDQTVITERDMVLDREGNLISAEDQQPLIKIIVNPVTDSESSEVQEDQVPSKKEQQSQLQTQKGQEDDRLPDLEVYTPAEKNHSKRKTFEALEGFCDQIEETEEREVMEDDQGHIHIHERKITNQNGKVTVVETDVIEDSHHHPISVETDIVQIKEGRDGTIKQHERHIKEDQQNHIFYETEQNSSMVPDQETLTEKKFGISEQYIPEPQKTEEKQEEENKNTNQIVFQVENADSSEASSVIKSSVERQVIQDEEGNIHTVERKTNTNEEGTVTVIETEEVRNQDGQLIKVDTDTKTIERGMDGSIHTHERDVVEEPGKVISMEKDQMQSSDHGIQSHTDIVEIEQKEDGTFHRYEMEIEQSNENIIVKEKDVIEDNKGNILEEKFEQSETNKNEEGEVEEGEEERQRRSAKRIKKTNSDYEGQFKFKDEDDEENAEQKEKKLREASQAANLIEFDVYEDQRKNSQEKGQIEQQSDEKLQKPFQIDSAALERQLYGSDESKDKEVNVDVLEGGQEQMDKVNIGESAQLSEEMKKSKDPHKQSLVKSTEIMDLLGLTPPDDSMSPKEPAKIVPREVTSIYNDDELLLLQSKKQAEQASSQEVSGIKKVEEDDDDLLISGNTNKMVEPPSKELIKPQNLFEQENQQGSDMWPKQYTIILKRHTAQDYQIVVQHDFNIEDLARKFAEETNKDRDRLSFFVGGVQANEYEMIAELDIGPGSVVYFLESEQQ